MDFQFKYEYSALALRTLKPLSAEGDICHAALGLTSEVGEIADAIKAHMVYGKPLDGLQILEEVGDAYWFINLLCSRAGIEFSDLNFLHSPLEQNPAVAALVAAVFVGDILDVVVFDSTNTFGIAELRDASGLFGRLCQLTYYLNTILALYGFTPEQALRSNINKLFARYPYKYSDDSALTRDKEAEYRAMRGA